MTFNSKYENIKQLVQKELDFIENFMVQNINTREPLNSYIIKFLTSPSKRIRPALSVLFYKCIFGDIYNDQLKALSAIEIIHNASLIHDDIIDQSDTRRGLKTVNSIFGNKLGVICGDYLLSIAMNIITELDSINLVKNFSNTLNKMCVGEIGQNFDRFKIGTIEQYIEKSKNKTAYLFQSAMETPFVTRGIKKQEYLKKASNFGINTGIAFQIRDDLQNLIKSDNLKPFKNDIDEGIYNAPVIFGGGVDKYKDGIEKTKDLLNNYLTNASLNLKELPENEYKTSLEKFLELLKDA